MARRNEITVKSVFRVTSLRGRRGLPLRVEGVNRQERSHYLRKGDTYLGTIGLTKLVFIDGAAYTSLTFGRRPHMMTIILIVYRKTNQDPGDPRYESCRRLEKPVPSLGGSACKKVSRY